MGERGFDSGLLYGLQLLQSLGIIHFSLFVQIGAQFRIMDCLLFMMLSLVLPASSVEAL